MNSLEGANHTTSQPVAAAENQTRLFSYVPHHRTLTKSGGSHFSRVPDAIAEFIDNSLQATQHNHDERIIQVSLDLKYYDSGKSFITICDNGRGMNETEIRRFAKYCDAKQYDRDGSQDPTNISMFGVGSKEAGFYLGERIHVVTKSQDCDRVIELVLDERDIEEKERNDQNVFEGNYSLLPLGNRSDTWQNSKYPSKIQEMRNEYELHSRHNNQTFTMIVLKLRDIIVGNLRRGDPVHTVPPALADLYHFHLHPEHLPNPTMERMSSAFAAEEESQPRTSRRSQLKWKDPFSGNSLKYHSNSIYQSPPTPLSLILEISAPGERTIRHDLKHFADDTSTLLFQDAKFCFRFTFQFPDPNFDVRPHSIQANEALAASSIPELWYHELSGSSHREVTAHGLLLYFPFHDGKSTRPSTSITSNSQEDDENSELVEATPDEEKIFRVYWQNRLVPETQLARMPFFPSAKSAFQCQQAKLPLEWRDRIRGFIFFDSNFVNISNNKLKIKSDPDFDTWINCKVTKKNITYNPKKISDDFKQWLQFCYQTFDDEFKFESRSHDEEKIREVNKLSKKVKYYFLFSQLTHTIGWSLHLPPLLPPVLHHLIDQLIGYLGQHQHVIRINNSIKISQSKSPRGRKDFIYVKVLGLLPATDSLRVDQDTWNGMGFLWCQQIPTEVYGNIQSIVPITSIDFKNYQVSELDLESVKNQAACGIKTVVYRTPEHYDGESITEGLIVNAGEKIDYLTVRVVNKFDETILSPPGSNKKYQIRFTIPTMNLTIGTSGKTFSRDISTSRVTFVNPDNRIKEPHLGFHLFQNICFKESGDHTIRIEVLDPRDDDEEEDKAVLTVVDYPLIIKSGPVAKFAIEGDFSSPVALGCYLPRFSLFFRDESDHRAIPLGRFSVSLTSPGLKFMHNGVSHPEFEADSSDCLSFDDNQWLAVPISSHMSSQTDSFISSTKVGSKKVKISVIVDCCESQKTFHITYIPGCPHRLEFLNPYDGRVSVPNGDLIEEITLACFDEYGNRCAPTPQFGTNWYIQLDDRGPITSDIVQYRIQSDGTVALSDLVAEIDEVVTFPGKLLIQSLHLKWPTQSGLSQDSVVKKDLYVKVVPGTKPTSAEVLYGDDILTMKDFSVGTIMTGLKLQIMTESNTPWEPSTNSTLAVKADWNKTPTSSKKRPRGKKGGSSGGGQGGGSINVLDNLETVFNLPNLQLPTDLSDPRKLYEVECTIDSKYTFTTQFCVNLLPSTPIKWKIFLSSTANTGIQCDPGVLSRHVQGVWLVDEYDNVCEGDFLPTTPPSLCVSWEQEDTLPTEGTQQLQLTLEDDDSSMNVIGITSEKSTTQQQRRYVLSPDATLICNRSLPAPFWLWVYDESQSYTSSVVSLTATASSPSTIFLRCSSIFGDEMTPTQQLDPIPFTKSSQLNDLEIILMDSHGREASLTNLQDLQLRITTNITSELIGLEIETKEIIFYQKRNPKNKQKNISIKFSQLIDAVERFRPLVNKEIFELIVTCSYSLNGQKVTLPTSSIQCQYLLFNLVNKLHLTYDLDERGNSSSQHHHPHPHLSHLDQQQNPSTLSISCGKLLQINLTIETEDDQMVEIHSDDITIEITFHDENRNESIEKLINIDEMRATFTVGQTNTNQTMVSYLLPELKRKGKYSLIFTYHEKRPKIITNNFIQKAQLTCKANLIINCLAGPGITLEPSMKCRHKLHGLSATASSSSSVSDRIIIESLEFILKDKYGNEAEFPDNSFVICRLTRLTSDNSNNSHENLTRNTPQFAGQQGEGVDQLKSIPTTQCCHSFPKIQLQPSNEFVGGDGDIQVSFELHAGLQQYQWNTVEKFSFRFKFTTDEDRALQDRKCREETSLIRQELDRLLENQRSFDEELKSIKEQIGDCIKRSRGLNLGGYLSTSSLSQSDLLNYQNEISIIKRDILKATSHIRKAQKINPIVIPEKLIEDGVVYGQVVDVGFVDSESSKLLEVMSWAAAGFMHALIVPNETPRCEGYFREQNVSFWEVDQIVPYRNNKGKTRTQNDINQQILPLELSHLSISSIPGNPRFMVNLIHLDPQLEHLRETIFYQIFQNSILINTEQDARSCRSIFLQNKIFPMPTIYTLDGFRLRGDGLNYLPNDRLPHKLDHLFGEKHESNTQEVKRIDQEMSLLEEILELRGEEVRIGRLREECEREIEERREEIDDIERRYEREQVKYGRKFNEVEEEEEEMVEEGGNTANIQQRQKKRRTYK